MHSQIFRIADVGKKRVLIEIAVERQKQQWTTGKRFIFSSRLCVTLFVFHHSVFSVFMWRSVLFCSPPVSSALCCPPLLSSPRPLLRRRIPPRPPAPPRSSFLISATTTCSFFLPFSRLDLFCTPSAALLNIGAAVYCPLTPAPFPSPLLPTPRFCLEFYLSSPSSAYTALSQLLPVLRVFLLSFFHCVLRSTHLTDSLLFSSAFQSPPNLLPESTLSVHPNAQYRRSE